MGMLVDVVLSCLGLIVVIVTLMPLSHCPAWWVRIWDFPRLQIFCLATILVGVGGYRLIVEAQQNTFGWLLVAATLASALYQLYWIIPYTTPFPNEVKSAHHKHPDFLLRILTSNVLMTNKRASALLALINELQPDLLVTLETNSWWENQLHPLQQIYPYRVSAPQENMYGMHVFSKLPLREPKIRFLLEDDVPSMHMEVQLRCGVWVRAHFLHPAPPSPTENDESTERDAELLLLASVLSKTGEPIVVAGDLNDVAWSRTTRLFRKVSGLLDPRVGRGMFNTFHADHWYLRWPLDHFFHSDHFQVAHLARLPSIGSDHFPVMIDLVYAPAQKHQQEGLKAKVEDLLVAEEKIEVAVASVTKVASEKELNHHSP